MKKFIYPILTIAFVIFFVIFIAVLVRQGKEVYKYPAFTTATITGYTHNGSLRLIYSYEVDGVVYEKSDYTSFQQTKYSKFEGKKFKVAYSTKHPN